MTNDINHVAFSYFDQFEIVRILEIHPFGDLDISITNSTVFMILSLIFFIFMYKTNTENGLLVPGRYQSVLEMSYETVHNMVKENIGEEGNRFFPFLLTLFLFIVIMNLFGLVPYTFTPTSHGAVTFGLSITIFIGCNIIAFTKHGMDYFSMFMPSGVSPAIAPFLVAIEFISYFAKPLSLGLRLAANITAGHLLLTIISSFVFQMLCAGGGVAIGGCFVMFILFFITILEMAVAVIQAYVFCLLTTIYLNDSFHLH
jgi:ATP synthase subunit 6